MRPFRGSSIPAHLSRVKMYWPSRMNSPLYMDVPHTIACGNGTDALQVAMMALELQPGDEVITTPFTFISTVEVIRLLGLKPVLVDVLEDTFNLDPDSA